jgi:hypothetical protein
LIKIVFLSTGFVFVSSSELIFTSIVLFKSFLISLEKKVRISLSEFFSNKGWRVDLDNNVSAIKIGTPFLIAI